MSRTRPQRCFRLAAAAAGALALLGCSTAATTEVMGSWRDADFRGTAGRVMVLSRAEEPAIRRLVERTLADKLQRRGDSAVPSTSLMALDDPVNRETVTRAIAGKGIDSVLVTRLIGVEFDRSYVPPDPTVYHLGAPATVAVTPGYTLNRSEVFVEISLYDTAHGQLVWSMTTRSVNHGTVADVVQSYTDAVVRRLAAQGLL